MQLARTYPRLLPTPEPCPAIPPQQQPYRTHPFPLGALKNLIYLALDRNSLSGEIPVELGTIPLKTLVLEFNSELCGPLPSSFSARIGKMDGLFVDGTAIVGVTRTDGSGLNSVMDIQKLIDAGMAVNSGLLRKKGSTFSINNESACLTSDAMLGTVLPKS
ncbi:hypothetical protein BCR33DRAFT_799947 [Rhizoclosmatium globosum]|uniref:L domain-like protein n=1 Tax=Rhizoclosmatium globosum TaxID=329046 RepID=A0A1Y1ZZF7_9FUNG|nr:hypothetical protein BCR33DRAFT_799947 [Rhizoclosmatium globosum]|eukprot:ORY15651.1 hypothetical protein BCR33DRAFT_799947 [Rhizoclosmatium globosum]